MRPAWLSHLGSDVIDGKMSAVTARRYGIFFFSLMAIDLKTSRDSYIKQEITCSWRYDFPGPLSYPWQWTAGVDDAHVE